MMEMEELDFAFMMNSYYESIVNEICDVARRKGIQAGFSDFEISINGICCSIYCMDAEKFEKARKEIREIERRHNVYVSNL